MMNYIYTIIIILIISYTFDKFQKKILPDEELGDNDLVNKYLLRTTDTFDNRPIIWIHSDNNKNAYIRCCLESIMRKCNSSFRICIIDDDTFKVLLPNWEVVISDFGDPIKKNIRDLAMAKLLYKYGGFQIPDSILVLKDLNALYNDNINTRGCFIGNKLSKSKDGKIPVCPNNKIIGCKMGCRIIKDYIHFLEQIVSSDHSSNVEFNCKIENFFSKRIFENKIINIDGKYFGIKDKYDNEINLDDLMGEKFIDLHEDVFAINIPNKELLVRKQYGWFTRLSKEQLLDANNILAKYFLISQN